MSVSLFVAATVAVLIGFTGPIAVVIAAAEALGASKEVQASWITLLCLTKGFTSIYLSWRTRMPVLTAWSTPGVALVAATNGISMPEAVGAFIFCSLLVMLTALIPPLTRLVRSIPPSLSAAMLAGIIFGFVIKPVGIVQEHALIVLPMLVAFFAARRWLKPWSSLVVLTVGILVSSIFYPVEQWPGPELPTITFIWPDLRPDILIGLGLPLYLVTMASQNLAGIAVLKSFRFEPPLGSVLATTGFASFVSAFMAASPIGLAAINATVCADESAHPDPSKRWIAGIIYGGGYLLLAATGGMVIALFHVLPGEMLIVLAAAVLAAPMTHSLYNALRDESDRFAAAITFTVAASGMTILGIGAAFWGLLLGLAVLRAERSDT